jgi:ATP-dependent Clp protease protease subunit
MEVNIKKISLTGPVDTDVTLKDLIAQTGDVSLFKTLVLDIASQGGCVEEGLKIMIWLDKLSQEGKEIITVVSANAYSIASLIMLAADKRYISKHGEVMVHNPMVPLIEYANANELEKHVEELRSLEDMLQMLYMNFANISIEDIKELMDNETYLSPDEAVLRGFADAVIDVKPKPYAMMAIKKDLNMSKLNVRNQLNVVIAALNGASVVNQMYYNTKGDEIQIFQSNPAKYAKEDKTSMEEGEVRLSDGTMLEIKNYEIVNITKEIEADEPVVAEDAIPEGGVEEVAPVAEVEGEEVKPVAENNVGPAPEEILTKAVAQAIDEPVAVEQTFPAAPFVPVAPVAPVSVEEVVEPVVAVEEVVEPVVAVEDVPVAPVEEVIAAVEEGQETPAPIEPVEEVVAEEPDAHKDAMDAMESKLVSLLERIEALEGTSISTDADMKAAGEAIDLLARNTSSVFKPEARRVSKADDSSAPMGLSLFQRMRFNK